MTASPQTGYGAPALSDPIDSVFGPEGALAGAFLGYRPRAGQLEFARGSEAAFRDGFVLMAEAGTGVGKSLAYLVPGIQAIKRTAGGKLLVVTSNIALQEQLVKKDLPLLQRIMPEQFTFALAKGWSNYLCFSGDTRVLTYDGIKRIADMGPGETVMDGNGDWVRADFKQYGIQRLMKIELSRAGSKKTIFATPEHRWFKLVRKDSTETEEVATKDLLPGDPLRTMSTRTIARQCRPSPFGVAHGIVFGDGTVFASTVNGWRTGTVVLHGDKRELLEWFPKSERVTVKLSEAYTEDEAVRVCDLPNGFKQFPSLDEAPSYLYGWLAGYFATDGTISESGSDVTMSSADRGNLEFVERLCIRLGIRTLPISTVSRVGIGQEEPSELYMLRFPASALDDSFFLLGKHRERYRRVTRERATRSFWKVDSVEMTTRVEAVFCCEVPTTASFVLEGYLLTGNCKEALSAQDPTMRRMSGKDEERPDFNEQRQLDRVLALEAEKQIEDGDLSGLEEELSPKVRRLVTIPSEECSGRKCTFYDACYPREARLKFRAADVIVTNYHLFCIDLAVRAAGGQGVLPNYTLLVLDEAHALPDIASEYFGFKSGFFPVRAAVAELDATGRRAERLELPRKVNTELRDTILAGATEFFGECDRVRRSPVYKARLDRREMIDGRHLASLLEQAAAALGEAAAGPTLLAEGRDFLRERAALCRRHAQLLSDARTLEDTEQVYFLEELGRDRTGLARRPISAAPFLAESLWENDDMPRGIVACSATLATGKGSDGFDYFANRAGIDAAKELIVESPFDYSRVAFVVPRNIPDPTKPDFLDAASGQLADLVRRAGGRTLALFTSYRGIDAAHKRLLAEDLHLKFKIMRQGEAPRTVLINRFKEDETSVLLGTESFWTGVDVPGPALSALFIDKLPFPRFDDPIIDAIKERDPEWFMSAYVPAALVAFKQGTGRLIRSVYDYGAIVCCDGRIFSKGYGRQFLNALPHAMKISRDVEDIDAVLALYREAV